MPIWRNHEVWIETDGERYEEYEVKVEDNVVTCHIASQVGKIFRINWRNHDVPLLISSGIYVKIDGDVLDALVPRHEQGRSAGESRGYWPDATSFKPYKFSNVTLTADGGVSATSDDIGSIVVTIKRVVVTSEAKQHTPLVLPNDLRMPLNERSKKMGTHKVDVDDNVQNSVVPRTSVSVKPYANDVGPYVIFRFVYRPKDILQALEIIPIAQIEQNKRMRLPSPIAGPSSAQDERRPKAKRRLKVEPGVIDLSDSDDDVERTLLAQQAGLARRLEQLRKRKASGAAEVTRKVKAESDTSRKVDLTSFVLDDKGVIDLTLD